MRTYLIILFIGLSYSITGQSREEILTIMKDYSLNYMNSEFSHDFVDYKLNPSIMRLEEIICEYSDKELVEQFLEMILYTSGSANETPADVLGGIYICNPDLVESVLASNYSSDYFLSILEFGFRNKFHGVDTNNVEYQNLRKRLELFKKYCILYKQTIYLEDYDFFDSLLSVNETPVFILSTHCGNCSKSIGDRTKQDSPSCFYNQEYWIIYKNQKNDSIESRISNRCFEKWIKEENGAKSYTLFEDLFLGVFGTSFSPELIRKKVYSSKGSDRKESVTIFRFIKVDTGKISVFEFDELWLLDFATNTASVQDLLVEFNRHFKDINKVENKIIGNWE